MRMRFRSPVAAPSADFAGAPTTLICAACGMPIADSLGRLGSIRCHDCRDDDAPIRAQLSTERTDPRELAHRSGGGLDVSLLWFEATGRVTVRVFDSRTGDRFDMSVKAADALNAFQHPFSYVTSRRARAATGLDERLIAADAA
jgi:hypothetical protein